MIVQPANLELAFPQSKGSETAPLSGQHRRLIFRLLTEALGLEASLYPEVFTSSCPEHRPETLIFGRSEPLSFIIFLQIPRIYAVNSHEIKAVAAPQCLLP